MKIYEVYDEVVSGGALYSSSTRRYSSKAEAEKALEYIKGLPVLPEFEPTTRGIRELEVEDTFIPWYTDDQVARWRREADEYQRYLDAMDAESQRAWDEMFEESDC